MPDGVPARAESPAIALPQVNVNVYQLALVIVLVAAFLTRFIRLGTPDEFYFDETYFPRTAQEIYRGDPRAWEFYGHENTHPPLSKLFMAGGMAVFEVGDSIFPALVPAVEVSITHTPGVSLARSPAWAPSCLCISSRESCSTARSPAWPALSC